MSVKKDFILNIYIYFRKSDIFKSRKQNYRLFLLMEKLCIEHQYEAKKEREMQQNNFQEFTSITMLLTDDAKAKRW